MMKPPQTDGLDEKYARMALRILTGPRDMDWHHEASRLMDHGPDYCYEKDSEGNQEMPQDVFELAGRMLGYFAGIVEWKPEE